MLTTRSKKRLGKNCIGRRKPGLPIARSLFFLSMRRKIIPQANEPLRRNCGGRTVHRFPFVEGIGALAQIISQAMQIGCARVPHWDAVGATVSEIKISRRGGRPQKYIHKSALCTE